VDDKPIHGATGKRRSPHEIIEKERPMMKNFWLERKIARQRMEARWKRIEMMVKGVVHGLKKVKDGSN
jgi:hypothetical protein